LQIGGSALFRASEEVLAQAKQLAAHMLEASADDIVIGEGGLQVAGGAAGTLAWVELAGARKGPARRPQGMAEPPQAARDDEDGNRTTANLMDYAMPSAAELPSYEVFNTETPSPHNPLGAKGIGESATLGSTPAVHNAIVDAISHLGVRHIDMPCTAERVW